MADIKEVGKKVGKAIGKGTQTVGNAVGNTGMFKHVSDVREKARMIGQLTAADNKLKEAQSLADSDKEKAKDLFKVALQEFLRLATMVKNTTFGAKAGAIAGGAAAGAAIGTLAGAFTGVAKTGKAVVQGAKDTGSAVKKGAEDTIESGYAGVDKGMAAGKKLDDAAREKVEKAGGDPEHVGNKAAYVGGTIGAVAGLSAGIGKGVANTVGEVVKGSAKTAGQAALTPVRTLKGAGIGTVGGAIIGGGLSAAKGAVEKGRLIQMLADRVARCIAGLKSLGDTTTINNFKGQINNVLGKKAPALETLKGWFEEYALECGLPEFTAVVYAQNMATAVEAWLNDVEDHPAYERMAI
jgi:hypothetical protein